MIYILVDVVIKSLRSARDFNVGRKVEIFHVVGTLPLFVGIPFAGAAESFDRIELAFLHFDVGVRFYRWH